MRAALTVWLVIFSLAGCSPQPRPVTVADQDAPVIGGKVTSAQSEIAKHLVMIYDQQKKTICTGTLVHPQVILTAAHCINDPARSITLAFGVSPITGNYVARKSLSYAIHPQYNKNNYEERNDLALIRIAGTAPAGYVPALLPKANFPIVEGYRFTAAGYGRISALPNLEKENGAEVLRHTEQTIETFNSKKTQFLVNQANGRGVCAGDSGGPALMRYLGANYVTGVASAVWWAGRERPKDECKEKSIYVNLKAYDAWIEKNLQRLLQ